MSECALNLVVPLGPVRLAARLQDESLVATEFLYGGGRLRGPSSPLGREVARQIRAYLAEPGFRFDLPLRPRGTAFQQRVWSALRAISPGRLVTYGELAIDLGTAPRAVGNACRANGIPLVIPCHRVVGRDGLGGFAGQVAGARVDFKRWMLRHEGAI